jgi:hypothetical protein
VFCCCPQGQDLCVRRRIVTTLPLVTGGADHLTPDHHDCPDGDLSGLTG